MKSRSLVELSAADAREYFLSARNYFKQDMPPYIDYEPMLRRVANIIGSRSFADLAKVKNHRPANVPGVNYDFVGNKDGRFQWRPFELINPALYILLVNTVCAKQNWQMICEQIKSADRGVISNCGLLIKSQDHQTDTAAQVRSWWEQVEQRSLELSLQYTHLLHTDVTDCYGSLYTHSIPWALHGLEDSKRNRSDKLLGNRIDKLIQVGRYGQTNGISQGSTLMDLIAELVLSYVDRKINKTLEQSSNVTILRYRDDYRIFAMSDEAAEKTLKIVSDALRFVGMRLSPAKTVACRNVIEGAVKADKLAALMLLDLGETNAKTIQKQMLRLHQFGLEHPNSGALRRLLGDFYEKLFTVDDLRDDLWVLAAIAADIAQVSPGTIPAVAAILSLLINKENSKKKHALHEAVLTKMQRLPHCGYLEIWLQRIGYGQKFKKLQAYQEKICRIVEGDACDLWDMSWIKQPYQRKITQALHIVKEDQLQVTQPIIPPDEIRLFMSGYA